MLALATAAWIALAALLLFALLVVVLYAMSLVKEARGAAENFSVASARLREAAAELRVEAQRASERVERIGRPARRRNH